LKGLLPWFGNFWTALHLAAGMCFVIGLLIDYIVDEIVQQITSLIRLKIIIELYKKRQAVYDANFPSFPKQAWSQGCCCLKNPAYVINIDAMIPLSGEAVTARRLTADKVPRTGPFAIYRLKIAGIGGKSYICRYICYVMCTSSNIRGTSTNHNWTRPTEEDSLHQYCQAQ
jgi:hypothetical protein